MGYDIQRLDMRKVEDRVYCFDTNVWLLVLGIRTSPNAAEVKYIQFFNDTFQAAKSDKSHIILPVFTISEVINRFILNVKMVEYMEKKGERAYTPNYFKSKYRITAEYKQARAQIYDDLTIYASACQLVGDEFGAPGFTLSDLLDKAADGLDFIDNYLYTLARKHGAVFVTTDGDFLKEGLTIYTLNNTLLERMKEKLTIKR